MPLWLNIVFAALPTVSTLFMAMLALKFHSQQIETDLKIAKLESSILEKIAVITAQSGISETQRAQYNKDLERVEKGQSELGKKVESLQQTVITSLIQKAS
jgi:hypothetical protein